MSALAALVAASIWIISRWLGIGLPNFASTDDHGVPALRDLALALLILVNLTAVVGFGNRFRKGGEDLDRWLALSKA